MGKTDEQLEVYVEILNRLWQSIDIHPYLSGLLTKEQQSYLRTLASAVGINNWQPAAPHSDWDIDGNQLYKYDDEESRD